MTDGDFIVTLTRSFHLHFTLHWFLILPPMISTNLFTNIIAGLSLSLPHLQYHRITNFLFVLTQFMATGKIAEIICSSTIICFYIFISCLDVSISGAPPVTAVGLGGNETDRLALLSIKEKISRDPLGVMLSWNASLHFCSWQGVTCSKRHQRVTMLDLSSRQLVGSLSPHVGNMSFLKVLILRNNTFNLEIPQEIGRLFRLETLGLENNSFTGEVPSNLSHCLGLKYLGLDGNRLMGRIPVELGMSLKNLEILFLRSNNLTGEIPSSFGNLSSLVALAAAENSLVGSIPETLGNLRNLTYISVGANKLSGNIPLTVYNITSLYHIAVPENQIQGSLPLDFGFTLPNLRFLYMHSNLLDGEIPTSLSNSTNLQIISLSRNQLTRKIPSLERLLNLQGLGVHFNNLGYGKDDDLDFFSSLVNCTSLGAVSLSVNNFGGQLPQNIGNFSTRLRSIGMAANKLTGSIPSGIANLINFEVLSLEYNQLTGKIPEILGKLQKLKYMYVNGNKLSGEIPSSLGNLSLLYGLNLAQNQLEGNIPPSLGNCRLMIMLYLSQNKLSGTIPKEVIGLSSLSIQLDLSQNFLSGSVPLEVGKLVNIGYLDLSQNNLSGKLPSTIGSCISLEKLYLQGNFLEGSLPPSLSSLRGMEYLDFSYNNFSGQIPRYFESFNSLKVLNLSFNRFEGEIPIGGVFRNASAIAVSGNKNLCGGIPELGWPSCTYPKSRKGGLSLTVKLVLSIGCGFLGLTLSFAFLILCWSRNKKVRTCSKVQIESLLPNLSYGELLKATDGFSSVNLIGVGSFGSVYKGVLGQNGTTVAVKVLNLQHKGASKSFDAECEALKNLRHRNLVKLITSCSGLDFRGNDFKALIYEFMINGSLDTWLRPIPEEGKGSLDRRNLNFLQRLNIVIDIANALEYLHYGSKTPVVHCDLKPSNVLLDEDVTAHVGDFGLARFLHENALRSQKNDSSSIVIKGTIGYAAPEYGMGCEVSTYGDVYSFGIILLELFTGKRPTDDTFTNGLNLHQYTKMALPDGVKEILDPVLLHAMEERDISDDDDQIKRIEIDECLVSIFKIGIACTTESPKERLDIRAVVKDLVLIKENFCNALGPV